MLIGAIFLTLTNALTASAAEFSSARLLRYRIAWNGIPAASATVQITKDEFAGDVGCVVQATARTNRFVDLFWEYRGNARATFLVNGVTPLQFTYENRSDEHAEFAWIDFDLTKKRAHSVYIKKGRRREAEGPAADFLDPITAVFRAMASGPGVGDRLSYRVFTGRSYYRVILNVIEEDEITVPAGEFQAFKVEPEVWKLGKSEKRDERLRRAMIWVSRDPSRTLLRVRSQVFVGSVTLDLVSATAEAQTAAPQCEECEQHRGGRVSRSENDFQKRARPGTLPAEGTLADNVASLSTGANSLW